MRTFPNNTACAKKLQPRFVLLQEHFPCSARQRTDPCHVTTIDVGWNAERKRSRLHVLTCDAETHRGRFGARKRRSSSIVRSWSEIRRVYGSNSVVSKSDRANLSKTPKTTANENAHGAPLGDQGEPRLSAHLAL
jgi:hypothetical protein